MRGDARARAAGGVRGVVGVAKFYCTPAAAAAATTAVNAKYEQTIGDACLALSNMACHKKLGAPTIADQGGIAVLLKAASTYGKESVRVSEWAAIALANLASCENQDVLDAMLEQFLEHRADAGQIAERVGVPRELAEKIIRTVYRNEFKRRQLPPSLRVSRKSWVGRFYPIVQRFGA